MGIIQGIRRRLIGSKDTAGDYECQRCGERYERRRQICPICESYRIERSEW